MDLTRTIIAKSDQLNADDLISGPQTFTVTDVRMGDSEQPVCIVLAEWPDNRPFKPSKTVLRILVHAWGKESDNWPKGARMTLYRDAAVKWAGQAIGGIRVSHLSHIDGKLKVALQESKGKKVLYTVDPLPDAPAEPKAGDLLSAEQLTKIQTCIGLLGITDREQRLAGISRVVGRDIDSTKKLTKAEAHKVIDSLERRLHAQADKDAAADEALPLGEAS